MTQPTPDAGDDLKERATFANKYNWSSDKDYQIAVIMLRDVAADRERYFQARLAEVLPEKRATIGKKTVARELLTDEDRGFNDAISTIKQNAATARGEKNNES